MTLLNFAIVALRLLGIYFIIESLPLFGAFVLMMSVARQLATEPAVSHLSTGLVPALIPGTIEVVIGILLIVFSGKLARRVVSGVPEDSSAAGWTLPDIQTTAFAIAGIIIVAITLPNLGRAVMSLCAWLNYLCNYQQNYSYQHNTNVSSYQLSGTWINAIGVLLEFILGLLLLLNPRAFRNLWHRLRTAGTNP